jgi:hypothetical protein
MKQLPIYILLAVMAAMAVACGDSEEQKTWDEYTDWRETNEAWLNEQAALTNADGTPYYTKLVPDWNQGGYVLIHYFNDRELTKGNLSPIYTSTVDVKYIGKLYDDEPFDSSYLSASPADSVSRLALTSVIEGWVIAATNMHVGDSCEVLVPYSQGYGATATGSIKPYSALKFGIKLVGVPYLVAEP